MLNSALSFNAQRPRLTRLSRALFLAAFLSTWQISAQNQVIDYENRLYDTLIATRNAGKNTVALYPRRIDTVSLAGPGPLKITFADGSSIYDTDMKGYKPGYSAHVKVYFDTSLYSIEYLDTPTQTTLPSTNSQNSASQSDSGSTGGGGAGGGGGGSGGSGGGSGTNSTRKSYSGPTTNAFSKTADPKQNGIVRHKPDFKPAASQTNAIEVITAKTNQNDGFGIVYVTPSNPIPQKGGGRALATTFSHVLAPLQVAKKGNRDIYVGTGIILVIAVVLFKRRAHRSNQNRETQSANEK